MGRGITASEKHGVNPSLGVCFWCGKEDGTVLLMGRLPGDAEAPRHAVASYEPCAECASNFAKGVVLIECTTRQKHEKQTEIQVGLYPTGNWLVMTREAVMRLFQPIELAKQVVTMGKAFIEPEAFAKLQPAVQ
jgi:hypothetical protein